MLSIRGQPNGGVIVPKNFATKGLRPVGKDDVILGEAFFRCGWRGDNEYGAAAKIKIHNGAIILGKSFESTVWRSSEKVEVADYR